MYTNWLSELGAKLGNFVRGNGFNLSGYQPTVGPPWIKSDTGTSGSAGANASSDEQMMQVIIIGVVLLIVAKFLRN